MAELGKSVGVNLLGDEEGFIGKKKLEMEKRDRKAISSTGVDNSFK